MTMIETENEVRRHLASDPHYPLGERDAMEWAIAFRIVREGKGPPDDGDMVGWFANCMATQEMIDRGGSFLNADGMQAILDGEIEAHPEFHR